MGITRTPPYRLTKGIYWRERDRTYIKKDFDVKQPTVGPIVGYTTPEHVRIFVRGVPDNNYPVFAGIRHRKVGDEAWSPGVYSRLSTKYDMADTLVLNNLSADTQYEYQAGWFTTVNHDHTPETVGQLPLQWPATTYTFKTASSKRNRTHRYVVGSCRYLRLTLGVASAPHVGDEIFGAIKSLSDNHGLDGLLMVGDQVYVDDLNIVAPDREYTAITQKYRAAFSQPHIRNLMATTPTYMILDDHEIEDNWPANQGRTDKQLYANAMRAYEIYQCSHSPIHDLSPTGHINRKPNQYWYSFANGDTEWFVMDCRTQRTPSGSDKNLIDPEQEHALLKWLIHSTAKVKFVVTSVLFLLDQKKHSSDWASYPAQRNRILETIRSNKINNVIVVCGDIHGSLTSQLTHSEDPDFIVHSIVSSPLCNSKMLPYAKASDLFFDKPLTVVGAGAYLPALTSKFVSQDNFACMTLEGDKLKVDFHDKKGKTIESVTIKLKERS